MDRNALIAVAVGSALGGVTRYLVGAWFVQRMFANPFPWGTFTINVTGSFVIGIVAEFSISKAFGVTPLVRLFTATGFLGGYTTFSAYSLETAALLQDGKTAIALLYALGSVAAGVAGAGAGIALAKLAVR